MTAFQDREQEIAQILEDAEQNPIVHIHGEVGIGKTRLLDEVALQLSGWSPPALVIRVDLSILADSDADREEKLLRTLIVQAQNWLSGHWRDPKQVAGQILVQLTALTTRMPVVLMFDTTESVQEDMEFWKWLEENLVGPLVIEGQVRQIFAGRVPAPWRRVEVRRSLKLLSLGTLSPQEYGRRLVRETLPKPVDEACQKTIEQVIDLVLEFSFGHPLLSETLGTHISSQWPVTVNEEFRWMLCNQVVKPFIDERVFEGIEPPWKRILWLASVLDWFDATILAKYLAHFEPALAEGQPDYFYIQGIARLRIRHTLVWREQEGDRLRGVIRDIVRHCFEIVDPPGYRQACEAASQTFEALGHDFPEEDPGGEMYYQEAITYRVRAQEVGAHESARVA